MAFLIFRCGKCGEAVRTVHRPQYRGNQEVITPLRCEDCKAGNVKQAVVRVSYLLRNFLKFSA